MYIYHKYRRYIFEFSVCVCMCERDTTVDTEITVIVAAQLHQKIPHPIDHKNVVSIVEIIIFEELLNKTTQQQ